MAYPLKLMARLYRLEPLADGQGLSPDERVALRPERSQPVLEKLRRWLAATHGREPPASDLAQAAAYMINHGVALTRFLPEGRLQLDNNLCEPPRWAIALGRNNFSPETRPLYGESTTYGERVSGSRNHPKGGRALYSLTRTCARHTVSPLAYSPPPCANWPRAGPKPY